MGYSGSRDTIQFVSTLSGSVSLCASLYCASQLQRGANGQYSLTDSMLIVLLIVDIVLSVFFAIGTSGATNIHLCRLQVEFQCCVGVAFLYMRLLYCVLGFFHSMVCFGWYFLAGL